jgi:hypothetical protein
MIACHRSRTAAKAASSRPYVETVTPVSPASFQPTATRWPSGSTVIRCQRLACHGSPSTLGGSALPVR